jgi:hypothetical protein
MAMRVYSGTNETVTGSLLCTWARISARPGTTEGMRMVMRVGQVPTLPSKKTSGLPMWAWLDSGHNRISQKSRTKRVHLDAVLVAQPSRLRVPAASRCEDPVVVFDLRGGTPPELAGEDACGTISPDDGKDSVKMHPTKRGFIAVPFASNCRG